MPRGAPSAACTIPPARRELSLLDPCTYPFHRCHPRDLSASQITAFLNHLSVERRVAASTQNQALCAVLSLYWRVLDLPVPELQGLERTRRPEHLRAVLSRRKVVLLLECRAIRVKDVDLERRPIMIRRGKGEHDRPALLPARTGDGLRAQLDRVAMGATSDAHVTLLVSPGVLAFVGEMGRRWMRGAEG